MEHKKKHRDEIAQATVDYLARGKSIQECSIGASALEPDKTLNRAQSLARRKRLNNCERGSAVARRAGNGSN